MKNNLDNENNNKLDSTMRLRLTLYSTILAASTIVGVALYKNTNDLNKEAVEVLENNEKSTVQTTEIIETFLEQAKSNSDNKETSFAPIGWEMIPGTNFCQKKTNDATNEIEEETTKSNENSNGYYAPNGWVMIPGTNFCQREVTLPETDNKEYGRSRTIKTINYTLFLMK